MKCPSCPGKVLPSHRYCPSCAALVGSLSETPTAAVDTIQAGGRPPGSPVLEMPVGRVISSGSLQVGEFARGMILAGSYRIIGLLGPGRMNVGRRPDELLLTTHL